MKQENILLFSETPTALQGLSAYAREIEASDAHAAPKVRVLRTLLRDVVLARV